jgi:hypothetical protein
MKTFTKAIYVITGRDRRRYVCTNSATGATSDRMGYEMLLVPSDTVEWQPPKDRVYTTNKSIPREHTAWCWSTDAGPKKKEFIFPQRSEENTRFPSERAVCHMTNKTESAAWRIVGPICDVIVNHRQLVLVVVQCSIHTVQDEKFKSHVTMSHDVTWQHNLRVLLGALEGQNCCDVGTQNVPGCERETRQGKQITFLVRDLTVQDRRSNVTTLIMTNSLSPATRSPNAISD